jgi:uncharacterized protein
VSTNLRLQDDLIVGEVRHALADLVATYRFGSSAEGSAHPRSDTDIAVLARSPLSATARFDLQERLAARLGHDVDLVDLAGASPVFAVQVIGRGRVIYDGDPVARGAFEDRTLGAYARLNEERRAILDRVRAEGTIYGR